MGLFIISVIFCSIMGSFFSLMVCGNLEGKIKPWINAIIGVAVAVAFGFAMTGIMWAEDAHNRNIYNNGICSLCSGEYHFSGGSEYRTSHTYYYTCESCGHTIETNSLMK